MSAALAVPVTLRAARPTDIEAMASLERQAFSDPWPASAFRDLIRQSHARLTVALDARGELCGYCILLHVLDEGEIANIAVDPAWRRRGIASRLLDAALDDVIALGLTTVFLEVRVSNEPARRLYESRGFAPIGRRRAYYREPLEDALVLRWQAPGPA